MVWYGYGMVCDVVWCGIVTVGYSVSMAWRGIVYCRVRCGMEHGRQTINSCATLSHCGAHINSCGKAPGVGRGGLLSVFAMRRFFQVGGC